MKDKVSVLVVDDEPGIRFLLSNLLKDMGIAEVKSASGGEEAVQILMREKIDMMLLDLKMPGMDGQETASRAFQIWPDIVIIIVTGYATIESAVELMKGGVFDIIRKPFRYEELKEKFDKALAEAARKAQAKEERKSVRKLGRFTLLSELSRGGMGVVYKATVEGDDKMFALKLLEGRKDNQDQVARFYLEGDTIAKLKHPGIVQIHDMGMTEGVPFIAMEYIDGVSLYELIYDNQLTYKDGLKILAEVLDAVEYAHGKNIIHRDLKPSNILVDRNGRSHIIDFGLAKLLVGHIKITQTDLILGTFGYLAPERLVGEHVDNRADIYSMGAILYEMLTHRLPYEKEDDVNVFPVFVNGATPPHEINPKVPPALEKICLKAIAVRREDRYSSAAEFAVDLRNFIEDMNRDTTCC